MDVRLRGLGWIVMAVLAGTCNGALAGPAPQPAEAVVAGSSPQRAELNARVYDSVVQQVSRDFRDPDFGGVDFAGEAEARRAGIIAQPDELGFYYQLNQLLDVLGDSHTIATSPVDVARIRLGRDQALASYGFRSMGRGRQLLVSRVHPQGPADLAGVQPGWRWLGAADGRAPDEIPAPRDCDSETLLFLDAGGQRHTISLTAETLPPLPRYEALHIREGIGYVWFETFDEDTLDWLRDTLVEWAKAGETGG